MLLSIVSIGIQKTLIFMVLSIKMGADLSYMDRLVFDQTLYPFLYCYMTPFRKWL